MKREKALIINNCADCKHRKLKTICDYPSKKAWACSKSPNFKTIKNSIIIPKWCPLEDAK